MTNILMGVSGGIAAYKSCDLINLLRKSGKDVRVVMTEHSKEFITSMTLATLSRHPVMDDMWAERDGNVEHIDIGKWTDIFIVYPATSNIIAKFANGIADDLLSTIYLALPPGTIRFVFPAANPNMLNHPATQRNFKTLTDDKVLVMDTRETELACRDFGKGAVLSPKEAFDLITGTSQRYKKIFDSPCGKDNPCGKISLGVPQKFVYSIDRDDLGTALGGPVPSDVTCGGLDKPKDYSNHEVPIG